MKFTCKNLKIRKGYVIEKDKCLAIFKKESEPHIFTDKTIAKAWAKQLDGKVRKVICNAD